MTDRLGRAPMYDPRSGESPLNLLAGPSDPLKYFRMKERARQLLQVHKYRYRITEGDVSPAAASEAEPLAEQLVRAYPRDPDNWLLLATAKKLLKKHAEAAAAYERQGALAGWDPEAAIGAMVNHVLAGNKSAAMDLVRRQILERATNNRAAYYDIDELAPLRDDPEFLALVGRIDSSSWSRTEGWNKDIDFLLNEISRANAEYRDRPLPEEFISGIAHLRRDIPRLSDERVFVQLNRVLATLHQGHTNLWEPKGKGPMNPRIVPLGFHLFREGLFIINAAPAHHGLIGSKVVAINKTPALEALRMVSETVSGDGPMEYVWKGAYLTSYAPLLKGLGIIDEVDALDVTLEDSSGARRTVPLKTTSDLGWFDSIAPGKHAFNLNGYKGMRYHVERAVPEHDALYVLFNQVRNEEKQTLAEFGTRLNRVLRASRPKNIVLDMRANAGGSTSDYANLLRTLTAFSLEPGNQVYVLTARRTYSAASNFITELEHLANPVFIGEPASQCCNLNGDFSTFVLPYSKIGGTMPVIKWNLSDPYDTRREISPQVPVQMTAKDYFAGRDTVLETAYRLIDETRARRRVKGR
ncbi:MAG TPA: hypothetical protein VIL42_10160 [Sphingomicrobium sp.]